MTTLSLSPTLPLSPSLPLLLLTLSSLTGCSPSGPQQYDLSGHVTFQGQPVPAGAIIFEPDYSKGNDGPQGLAIITSGTYTTARGGKKTIGGPHTITILGCDGKNISETSPQGKPLFDPHITTLDLPKKSSQHDFDIPSTKKFPR